MAAAGTVGLPEACQRALKMPAPVVRYWHMAPKRRAWHSMAAQSGSQACFHPRESSFRIGASLSWVITPIAGLPQQQLVGISGHRLVDVRCPGGLG